MAIDSQLREEGETKRRIGGKELLYSLRQSR